jgi:hypothetical protein
MDAKPRKGWPAELLSFPYRSWNPKTGEIRWDRIGTAVK